MYVLLSYNPNTQTYWYQTTHGFSYNLALCLYTEESSPKFSRTYKQFSNFLRVGELPPAKIYKIRKFPNALRNLDLLDLVKPVYITQAHEVYRVADNSFVEQYETFDSIIQDYYSVRLVNKKITYKLSEIIWT